MWYKSTNILSFQADGTEKSWHLNQVHKLVFSTKALRKFGKAENMPQ